MRTTRFLVPAIVLISLAACWELAVFALAVPKWILPAPSAIWQAFWDTRALMGTHVGQTMLEVAIGIGVALLTGVTVAAVLDFSPWLRRAVYPLLVISQTVPILALAPLLIIWFGFGITPKVIVVTLFCFFPIAINTSDGLTSTEPELIDLFRSMGATWPQIWIKGSAASRCAILLLGTEDRRHVQRSWRGRRGVGWRQTRAGNIYAALFGGIPDRSGLLGHRHYFAPEHSPVPDGLCDRARDDALVL